MSELQCSFFRSDPIQSGKHSRAKLKNYGKFQFRFLPKSNRINENATHKQKRTKKRKRGDMGNRKTKPSVDEVHLTGAAATATDATVATTTIKDEAGAANIDEKNLIPVGPSTLVKLARFMRSSSIFIFGSLVDDSTTLGFIWFLLVYTIFIYNALTVAWRICFYHWFTDPLYWIIPDQCTDLILYIDFVIRFFRPYQDTTTMAMVKHPKKTSWYYVRTGMILDLLGRLPFEWICFIVGYSAILRLNRMILIVNSLTELKRFEHTRIRMQSNHRVLIQFLYVIIIISHLLTCLWYLVVRVEYPVSREWTATRIYDGSWFFKYGFGLYFVLIVMAGYGGALPNTDLEVGYQLFISIIGFFLFVTIIGTVGSLVTNLDVTASEFRARMDTINEYMTYRNMSPELKTKVQQYYTHLWKTRKGLDETQVLEDLPDFLRVDVSMHLNREIIEKVPIFANSSPNFVSEVVMNLKPRLSLPGSYIIRIGEPGREMYFINKGKVKVKLESGLCVATLGEGDFFGEMALITGGIRTANIIAQTFCDLFILEKKDFDEILEAYPEEAENIINIGKKRDQSNQSQAIRANTARASRFNLSRGSFRGSTTSETRSETKETTNSGGSTNETKEESASNKAEEEHQEQPQNGGDNNGDKSSNKKQEQQ